LLQIAGVRHNTVVLTLLMVNKKQEKKNMNYTNLLSTYYTYYYRIEKNKRQSNITEMYSR